MINRSGVSFIVFVGFLFCFVASAWAWVDLDNDGVPDVKDACMDTKAGVLVNSSGCDVMDGTNKVCIPTLDGQLYPEDCTQASPLVLNFEFAKADVMFVQWQVFVGIKSFLLQHDVNLCLLGHTDSVGSEAGNMQLSYLRALNVKRILVDDLGFNPERFIVKGMADTQPIANNNLPDGRAVNRRVELFVELEGR
ncbi:MAG: OOP family OmpA-OmpF porin [Shewanella sp.]|jgi:OOP family OmpA-OmpF porin